MSEQKAGKTSRGFGGMLKLGLILAVYSAAACVGLAFVYAGTAKRIDENKEHEQTAALNELFPDAESFEAIRNLPGPDPDLRVSFEADGAFAALKNGAPIGVALRTSRASYGGPIKVLVGVGADNKICGVKILEHTDTPGLGANAASPTYFVDRASGKTFYGQFTGKSVNESFEVKRDVEAITAATITSRAVAASVKAAGEAASAWLAGGSR